MTFNLEFYIRIAGAIQLTDAALNFIVAPKIRPKENLGKVTPIFRQVFLSHWGFIIVTLVIFGFACVLFPGEIASGRGLGRFLAGSLAIFWAARWLLQVFFFDHEFRRANRAGDIAFQISVIFMGIVFGMAALGAGK